MIWKIRYINNTLIRTKILKLTKPVYTKGKLRKRAIPLKTILFFMSRLILSEIRTYIVRNQPRFNKTRTKLGISGPHMNYLPRNVRFLSVDNQYIYIDLKIKGIERNFKSLVITPKSSKYLTIPTDKRSYNKPARSFDNLFKPKGMNVLALKPKNKHQKSLEILYALTKKVRQPKTQMLPTETYLMHKVFKLLQTFDK